MGGIILKVDGKEKVHRYSWLGQNIGSKEHYHTENLVPIWTGSLEQGKHSITVEAVGNYDLSARFCSNGGCTLSTLLFE